MFKRNAACRDCTYLQSYAPSTSPSDFHLLACRLSLLSQAQEQQNQLLCTVKRKYILGRIVSHQEVHGGKTDYIAKHSCVI